MLGNTFAKKKTIKREKLLTKINSVGTNQPSGNFKTLPIDAGEGYANAQPNALVIHTIDFISVIFPCTPTCLK